MDVQVAIDRMMEIENLTDELDDDEANALLDWGASHVAELVEHIEDEEVAGSKLQELLAVLRKVNKLSVLRKHRTPEQLQAELGHYRELVRKAFDLGESKVDDVQSAQTVEMASAMPSQPLADLVNGLIQVADSEIAVARASAAPVAPAAPPTDSPAPPSTASVAMDQIGDAMSQISAAINTAFQQARTAETKPVPPKPPKPNDSTPE
jgi:hypothetical protein